MKYAIVSDIHSNIEAFTEVLKIIDDRGIDHIVCLGDVVGYNANPNEVIDILRERKIPSVIGNHDSRAASLEEPWNFNRLAQDAIYWTREILTPENLEYLKNMPKGLKTTNRLSAIHGWVHDNDSYILAEYEAKINFRLLEDSETEGICFFGHTHKPIIFEQTDKETEVVKIINETKTTLKNDKNYLINPGSVGQPRDRDPRAAFAFLDTDTMEYELIRVEYDIEACGKKIIEAGLPSKLAERLLNGF